MHRRCEKGNATGAGELAVAFGVGRLGPAHGALAFEAVHGGAYAHCKH